MCLIIYSPVGHEIPEEVVESALTYNGDGAGLMYWKDEKPVIWRNHNPSAHDVMDAISELKDVEFAIHFRMRTHGVVNPANTHPFKIL